MSSFAYRSVDDIQRFLADIWSTYPSVYASYNNEAKTNQMLALEVLSPLSQRSIEMCNALSTNKAEIKNSAKGGFGMVGPFLIKENGSEKQLKLHIISVDPQSKNKYKTYFVEVVAKTNKQLEIISLNVKKVDNLFYYTSNDYLHETIVGSLVSHLYDLGILLNTTKYFGTYVCNNATKSTLLMEKSSFELYEIFNFYDKKYTVPQKTMLSKIYNEVTAQDIKIWLVQLTHAFYTMKYYFGISHYDVHMRNVMLSAIHDKFFDIPSDKIISSMYGGKLLKDVEYILYELPFNSEKTGKRCYIIVENNGLIPKLIDYGITVANFSESVAHFDTPIVFMNSPNVYDRIWEAKNSMNTPYQGDVEYNFLCYNILYQLENIFQDANITDTSKKNKASSILMEIEQFMSATVGNYNKDMYRINNTMSNNSYYSNSSSNISVNIPNNFQVNPVDKRNWFMDKRNVGTTESITAPLVKLFAVLPKLDDNIAYVTRSNTKPELTKSEILNIPLTTNDYNPVSKFFSQSKSYYNLCLLGELPPNIFEQQAKTLGISVPQPITAQVKQNVCREAKELYLKSSPTSVMRQNMFTNEVDNSSTLIVNGKIKNNITSLDLKTYMRLNFSNILRLYTLKFNPISSGLGILHNTQRLDYKYSQILPNGEKPAPNKLGRLQKMVNIHLLYYSNKYGRISFSQSETDLFTAAFENLEPFRNGITIQSGMYLTRENEYRPIGFFFNRFLPHLTSTSIPVPNAYKKKWGVILGTTSGKISLGKYSDFINKHKTKEVDVIYQLTNNSGNNTKKYKTTTNVIDHINGLPLYKDGVPVEYDFACSSGPILIWNSRPIFTQEEMEMSLFEIDLIEEPPAGQIIAKQFQPYKLSENAQNNSMYFTEVGEEEDTSPYKQRTSNILDAHSVICETNKGEILFVFVEGRGFNAIGLDRVQLTELLMNFDIKNAISLDSGFGSNAIIKEDTIHKYLLQDPVKNPISMTINIGVL